MSNFNPGPAQEAGMTLKSGLKIQCFRRDPSKFFVDIQTWFNSLNIGHVDQWTVAADPSGHITLIVAYRENGSPDSNAELINTVGDLVDSIDSLCKQVAQLLPKERPPVSSSSEHEGAAVLAK